MDKNTIGATILAKRKEHGWTQKELAEKLHVTDKTISKWETGKHFPDIEIMEELADTLGISLQELLGLENESADKAISSLIDISKEEKKAILKDIRNRGFITVILGLFIWASVIYASKVLADNNIYGLPQMSTAGLSGSIGLIIANGLASIHKGSRLLKVV